MSKLIMYEWRCQSCDHKFDDLSQPDKHTLLCPVCGEQAKRLISTPRFPIRMGVDPSMPTMADKWSRMHEQARKVDEKRAADNGPSAWGADGADVRR